MSQTFTINGVGYSYPDQGDQNWGSNATNWASAVTTGMLQKAGGTFTLTADVNFGASFGLKSQYFVSRGTNAATAGVIRLAKTEGIEWRNNANGGNNVLTTDTSDQLLYNGVVIANAAGILPTTSGGTGLASYTAGDMVYYASGTAFTKLAIGTVSKALVSTGSAPSWALLVNANIDATAAIAYSKLTLTGSIVNADISASAAIAYSKLALTGSIVNADVSTSAAIAFSKLASLTSAHILVGSAGNVATDVAVSGDISITNAGVTAYAGTVSTAKGGTGLTSYTAGDTVYYASGTALTKVAIGAANTVNVSTGTAPSWSTSLALASTFSATTGSFSSVVGILAAAETDVALFIGAASTASTEVAQYGALCRFVGNASGTSSLFGFASQITSAASAYTLAVKAGFHVQNTTKGAGSTITRAIAYGGEAQTQGTNNAFLSDNAGFSGAFFIHSTDTNPSVFGGVVKAASGIVTKVSTANTSNPPTKAELTSAFGAPGTVGTGFVGIVDDNGGHANEYICWSDGTEWFYATGTKAA